MEPRHNDRGSNGARRAIGRRGLFLLGAGGAGGRGPFFLGWGWGGGGAGPRAGRAVCGGGAGPPAGLAVFWAALLSAEDLLGPGGPPRDRFERKGTDSPFGPPPPPGRR